MSEDAKAAAFFGSMLSIITFAIGVYVGDAARISKMESDAIRAHAGEYYLDANNQRQFRWLSNK